MPSLTLLRLFPPSSLVRLARVAGVIDPAERPARRRSEMPTMRNGDGYGGNGGRSEEWLERRDLDGFLHRPWLKSEGFSNASFRGRPPNGTCHSRSELRNWKVHPP